MSDLFSIAGKTALVTGGGQGIGLMISRGFIEAGVKVYISSRKIDVIEPAADELGALPGSRGCIPIQADLASAEEASASPTRSPSARAGGSTSWSTTPAPTGARPTRPSRTRRGTACSTSTSRACST